MTLARLEIRDVRCIAEAGLRFERGRNFLIGPNGAGKTSCLEAVYLLGRGRSFRTRQLRQVVRHGGGSLSVFGEVIGAVADSDGPDRRRLGVGFEGGKLIARLDGATAESLVELARAFPVHVIDPRLHQLVEAGPSERRRFIDGGVFHVEPSYLGHWRAYRRALGQRNAALKAGHRGSLGAWDEALRESAERVDQLRRDYAEGLGVLVSGIGRRLIGRELAVRYAPGWRSGLSFPEALQASLARDRVTGVTQVGPHRADLEVDFAEGGVRDIASRGQQKLVAAALVLGQLAELRRRTGMAGTLLVDDPAAELDDAALQRLLAEIAGLGTQSLITGLRLDGLGRLETEPVFHVEQGKIEAVL